MKAIRVPDQQILVDVKLHDVDFKWGLALTFLPKLANVVHDALHLYWTLAGARRERRKSISLA